MATCNQKPCDNEAQWKMIHAEQEPGIAVWWMDDIRPYRVHEVCHIHITTILNLPEPSYTSAPGIWFIMPLEEK